MNEISFNMSSTLISSLTFASKQISIYFGSVIFVAGMIGGLLNLLVFLSLKTFRQSSCAFYLTIMSAVNIGQMITGLLARIMESGFNINWSLLSPFYCKFRYYFFQTCALTSMVCLCLATVDQYLATCSRPRWQKWSNIKLARRLVIGFIFICSLYNIPFLIFFNQITTNTNTIVCKVTNTIFSQYNNYTTNIILGKIIPLSVTLIFGVLAYHNVQHLSHQTIPLVRRELDKQLTVMVLILVVFAVMTVAPFIIVFFLTMVPQITNDPLSNAQVQLAVTLTTCLVYLYFASPFYIFTCASSRFRRQLIFVLFEIYCKHRQQPRAALSQVIPDSH